MMRYQYTSISLGKKKPDNSKCWQRCRVIRISHFGKHLSSFLQSYTYTDYMIGQPSPRQKINENICSNKTLNVNVYSSGFIHNHQKLRTTYILIGKWVNKP